MTFDYNANLKSKNYKKIYEQLLNDMKNNEQEFKKEIKSLKNNCTVDYKTFREIINFQDDKGNTLLHYYIMQLLVTKLAQ